jgi:hypothetical protein
VSNPFGKLSRVGNCRGQKHIVHVVRQQDDRLLPHHAALLVPHVVDLVEDNPAHLPHDLAPAVQHRPQDLRRHDEAGGGGIDRHVAGHEANVGELLEELSIFLVAERLDAGLAIKKPPKNTPKNHLKNPLKMGFLEFFIIFNFYENNTNFSL